MQPSVAPQPPPLPLHTAMTDLKHDQRREHGESLGFPEPRAFPWCIRNAPSATTFALGLPTPTARTHMGSTERVEYTQGA